MKIFYKGFNFSQDGPGNRLVYHLQGCNMRCPWCSNPEGMEAHGGKNVSIEQIVEECTRSRLLFFSGGGVTFTGGEATLQHKELMEVLKRLKALGIHTALETNGSSPHLLEIQEHVDYLMMDFKHYDAEAFLKYTGVDISTLKSNYEGLQALNRQLHIRIPLINGVNADSPQGFIEYFARFPSENTVFEFLPYHEYGKEKWKGEYKMENAFVSSGQVAAFHRAFQENNLKTVKT